MFKNMKNIKIENIHSGTSKKASAVVSRKSSSLILRATGSARYIFPDYTIETHTNDIVFLPQGSRYDFISLFDEPCKYVAIRFENDLSGNEPFVYSLDNFSEISQLKNNLSDMWKFGGQTEHYMCYSIIYNLLAYMKNIEYLTYSSKKSFNVIAPAVEYLKKHIYDSDLKIETLIGLCNISGTYFHKIFQANYSISPQKYIQNMRLSQAKSIIDNGDFDTISELAFSIGYNDPLYFSRAFKKKYSVSPLNYAKQILINN